MKKTRKCGPTAESLKAIAHFAGNYRYLLLATALIAGGTGLREAQVLAQVVGGTTAGTPIRNTATATYQDPNNPDPNARLNAVSNTVTVQVAEVAGITVTTNGIAEAPNAANPVLTQGNGTIDTGDVVYFNYIITNVGNDPTQFFIPGAPASLTGASFNATTRPIEVVAVNGTNLGSPISVPATGSDTGTLAGLPNSGSFAPGQTVTIRVPVVVTANTSGAPISVTFGNTTPGANNSTQNQPYVSGGPAGANNDVYTVDNANGATDEVPGVPANGQQEASAAQQTFLAATPKAFATVLKTSGAFAVTTTPDGTLTYNLGLQVANTSPDPSFTAADLQGTTLTINSASVDNRILISDVIPASSTLVTPVSQGTLPPNWTIVYSGSDPNTTTALTAQWRTDPAAALADSGGTNRIQRIGFVYNASPVANGGSGPIARGANITGFQFSVTTSLGSSGGTIANIAQVFGQTSPTAGQPLVYDESGDAQPNNYNADNSPGPFSNVTPTEFNGNNPGAGQTTSDPNQFRGIAAPATQGVDNTNTNTGQGPGGENNVFAVQPTASILNGPNGQPAAVGPTNNNDDFTNKATDLPANPAPNTTFDPIEVVFTNTVNNPSSSATLTNILLRPVNLPIADVALLPNGTTVRITLGNNTGVYTYNNTNGQFTLTSGTPISIPSLGPNVSLNYETRIDLPTTTPLSTDLNRGFSVPIVAFIDDNGNGAYDSLTDRGNITIDRLYTGYLKLIKSARVLSSTGTALTAFTTQSSSLNPFLLPGNMLEYQIQYKNISEPSNGTGNLVLNANNVVITENGSAGTNNWFSTPTSPTRDSIFPSNPNGSAITTNGTLSVTVTNNDIQIYVNNAGAIVPSGSFTVDGVGVMTNPSGSFTFRRIIN